MQLYGMADEPVRAALDLTWWPSDDTFSTASRLFVRSSLTGSWEMQEMVAGPLLRRDLVVPELLAWAADWGTYLTELARQNDSHRIRR